ncbi:MAG: succinyl-CoA synthetase subunit beta [Pseudomonadota bacterium]
MRNRWVSYPRTITVTGFGGAVLALAMLFWTTPSGADASTAAAGMDRFSKNCFSPRMTGARAAEVFSGAGLRYDFYDLDPFLGSNAPTPATKAPVTEGTDRRCEVSFDGNHASDAVRAVTRALTRERIQTEVAVPATYAATEGTALLAARRLSPLKIAVVHVGTRPGPNGIETFMNVERIPLRQGSN